MGRRGAGLLVAAALAFGACGGRDEVYEVPPGAAVAQHWLPSPVEAVPVFLVRHDRRLDAGRIRRLERAAGVSVVAPLALERVRVEGPKGRTQRLRVGIVDPTTFRSVTPPGTRDADFVWSALVGGDAVLTHDAAERLRVRGAQRIAVARAGRLTVGAFADNGTPNVADVVVDQEHVPRRVTTRAAVIGAESGVTIQSLARQVKRRLPGARLEKLLPTRTVRRRVPAAAPSTPLIAGMHPTLADAVNRLIAAADGKIWVVSGFRTYAHQYQLWINALRKYGDPEIADDWVAHPGHSMHERGLAVDLGGDLALAVRLVRELRLPMWRPMSWEPWHFELVGSRG